MTNVITSVFDINSINYLLTEESTYRQHIDHYPLIFCTVNSIVNDFTIFSAIYLKNNKDFVIVGADINIQKNHDEQYSLLINHIISLRKIPSLCNIKIIFIPETTDCFTGVYLWQKLQKSGLQNIYTIYENNNKIGIRFTQTLKQILINELKINLKQQNVYFHEKMVCNGNIDEMKQSIVNKLKNYKHVIKVDSIQKFQIIEGHEIKDYCDFFNYCTDPQKLVIMIFHLLMD